MALPVFSSVIYLSPWLPLPPGFNIQGVDVVVNAPSGSGLALAGRLRQAGNALQVVVATNALEVIIVPAAPLSALLDYYVDIQWVALNTQPAQVTWTAGSYVTAPVVTAVLSLDAGAVTGSTVSLNWDFGAAAILPSGANISAFAIGSSAGFARVQGTSGAMALTGTPTAGTQLYLQGVMPISGKPGAGFVAPFSAGPIVSGAPLPLTPPTITNCFYDGATLQVGWTAPAAPATGGAVGYDLVALSGTTAAPAVSVFEAGPGGGRAVIGATPPSGTGSSVAARTRIGAMTGPISTPLPLITQPPVLDQIAVAATGTAVSVRVTFPTGMPSGASAMVTLNLNGAVMGIATPTASGTISITGLTSAADSWTVQAQMSAAITGGTLYGPWSAAIMVPNVAPVIADLTMVADPANAAGWIVTVTTAAAPPPGYGLVVALTQGSVAIASQSVTDGSTARFALTQGQAAANTIDGTKLATATLTIAGGVAAGPAAQATFIGAAPTITAVQNIAAGDPSGLPQGINVDAAVGGASGQRLTVQLLAGGSTVATATGPTATSAVVPLTMPLDPARDWRVRARWSGGGVTVATYGGWSASAPVLTAATAIVAADVDGDLLTLTMLAPMGGAAAQGGYLFANTSGGPIVGTNVVGTSGSLTLPSGTAGAWQAGAKPTQPLPATATSRSLAPSSALVPLLTTAPTLATVDYDGETLSATWSQVSDGGGNAATGAVMRVVDGTGTTIADVASSVSGAIGRHIAPSAQGTAMLSVRATRLAAGARFRGSYCTPLAPLVAVPTVGTVALSADGATVTAVLTAPAGVPAGTTYQAWLTAGGRIVAGPVAAVTATGVTSVTFSYGAAGVAGLAIVAQALATVSGVTLTGPRAQPVPVPAFAPSFSAVTITPSATAGQWQLDASWLPPADGSAIVTYTMRLADVTGGEVFVLTYGSATRGGYSFTGTGLRTDIAYILTIKATTANGSITPLGSASFWFTVPVFTSVAAGADAVAAHWTAPVGPVAPIYHLSLIDATTGAVLAADTTSATNGGFAVDRLRLAPGGGYALALATQTGPVLLAPGSDGTYATRPPLVLASPGALGIATDAASGKATLTWTAVTGASNYTVTFSDGRAPATSATASYVFPAALASPAPLIVTVAANIVANAVTTTGPASAPLTVPAIAPALATADYDGVSVSAAWQPVAGAAGYSVTVLDKDNAIAATSPTTTATALTFAAALTTAKAPFTAVVQATGAAGTGPPSPALPVFHTAWFVSTALPAAQPPAIYPAATLARAAAAISIYLPPLGPTTITVPTTGPFVLSANTDTGSSAAFPYVLTFAADSAVWTFATGGTPAPAIRPQLKADYITFLQAAETQGASAWGIAALQAAIARWMPQTFVESHYYAYGLDLGGGNGTGSIDLRPGLVLRVGFADYTNVWSGDANSWLNGFAGGSPTDFDVADSMSGAGLWQVSMDAFVARLTASGAMTVAAPVSLVSAATAAGVADAADLFFPNFPNPFYRLFFPGQLQGPTTTGSVATGSNFALASAGSFTALGASSATPGTNNAVAYFRGRAVLRVMIRIRVNGMEVIVPLGTTLGNVLDRYGVRPPATALQVTGVVLERAAGPGIAVLGSTPVPPQPSYAADQRHRVRIDWATMATYGGPVDATSLPLLHGDRIGF